MNVEDNPMIRAASSWQVAIDALRDKPLVGGQYSGLNLAFLSYGMEALRECD